MNRFGPRLRESSLPASLAQILAEGKEVPRWETWRQKNNVTAQKKQFKIQEFQGVFVLVEGLIFRHLFC